jgi:lipoprotein Spr
MGVKRLSYSLLCVLLLSGCRQFKALTAKDHSANVTPSQKSNPKKISFLDNISLRPQVVTSKHLSTGSNLPKTKIRKGTIVNVPEITAGASGDIERADWLQLKYAIMLDANVEKLTNINLLRVIDEWWGTSYCIGGSTKSCIDCSAFSHLIMQDVYNINLPRTAREQYSFSTHIGIEDLDEGDLVFFNTGGGRDISHVGIYLLNNKFIHAATSGGVMVSDLNDTYWKAHFKSAGRVKEGF